MALPFPLAPRWAVITTKRRKDPHTTYWWTLFSARRYSEKVHFSRSVIIVDRSNGNIIWSRTEV